MELYTLIFNRIFSKGYQACNCEFFEGTIFLRKFGPANEMFLNDILFTDN